MQSTRTRSCSAWLLGFLLGVSLLWPWVSRQARTAEDAHKMLDMQFPSLSDDTGERRSTPPATTQRYGQPITEPLTRAPLQFWHLDAREGIPTPPVVHPPSTTMPALSGWATLDRTNEVMTVHMQGLPTMQAFDIWVLEARSNVGTPSLSAVDDTKILLGSIRSSTGAATLHAKFPHRLLNRLRFDALVITLHGVAPTQDSLVFEPLTVLPPYILDGECPLAS